MSEFKVGDRVRIVSDRHGEGGDLFVIKSIHGNDNLAHELPYRSPAGFWYRASDLAIVQPAYAKEYAIDAPAQSTAGDSGYSELLDELSGRIKGLERELAAAETLAATNARLLDNAQHELDTVRTQLAQAQAARDAAIEKNAAAMWLLKSIERNMPTTKDLSDDPVKAAGFAHLAWMAGDMIRLYVADNTQASTPAGEEAG